MSDDVVTVDLITLESAAAICAEAGLPKFDRPFWIRQTDRGHIPCAILARKKRIRRDYVEQLLDSARQAGSRAS